MPASHQYFAYTIVEKDAGMITGRLLHVCPTLEAVCELLRTWNVQPHRVHVCGWDTRGQWVIPRDELERVMREGAAG